MVRDRILNVYASPHSREMAAAGKGIHGMIARAVQAQGWTLLWHGRFHPVTGPGYHLIENLPISQPHCLVLRRCHIEPFYRIEVTNDRWDWEVVAKTFAPKPCGEWFLKYWQKRIFADLPIAPRGYVFMPLQGKLLERRHFQALSPIDMIEATLKADRNRPIRATLHPNETYGPEEMAALQTFGERFALVEQPSMALLAGCDYVVTENSSMAFSGFFARKPAVLFAKMDFHHIAGSVPRQGIKAAFQQIKRPQPFASYLQWFLREEAISAWSEDAAPKIIQRFRDHGWPI